MIVSSNVVVFVLIVLVIVLDVYKVIGYSRSNSHCYIHRYSHNDNNRICNRRYISMSNVVSNLRSRSTSISSSIKDNINSPTLVPGAGYMNKEKPINIGNIAYDIVSNVAKTLVNPIETVDNSNSKLKDLVVVSALQKMEKDMELLDNVASRTPQLTTLEIIVLFSTVMISAFAPFGLPLKVVELLVPSMAAVSAAVGLSAEYVGKTAVSNGKEIAALAIQAAAESEALLASAERTKSILPLCVGIATTASAFSLLIPSFLVELQSKFSVPFATELLLISPFIAVLAAAIAGLATQESRGLASRAIGVGNRRFASSSAVGRTWLSATEQVEANSRRLSDKWTSFATGVLPAPIIACLFPGSLSFKSIVCAAIAAAQAAYYLSLAEYSISTAVDAVALKARASAVADTYANQGSRAGAILPFTSALGGLCAAASAAAVELLPLVNIVELQSFIAVIFPSGAALLAAAASISKARCEVDASAASAVAASGLTGGKGYRDPIVELRDLVVLSSNNTFQRFVQKVKRTRYLIKNKLNKLQKYIKKLLNRPDNNDTNALSIP
jgi:hypothetical protein